MPKLPHFVIPPVSIRRSASAKRYSGTGRWSRLRGFGTNPGNLNAHVYCPALLAADAALVVVLHGCTQTASDYDTGSGWSQMADLHGFALLFPEQQRANNPNLCFNWFNPDDSRRGSGEALSIREMIAAVVTAHSIDPARIFVTGLSAGGAMASILLATYPEIFAGGAIIAGLPFGCAATIPEAFDRMRGRGLPSEGELARLVRNASDHDGPWPTLSIWQGSADATVNPTNAEAIIGQWRSLHGVAAKPDRLEAVDGYPRRVWRNAAGRDVIEEFSITGMGHGTPLDTKANDGCGVAAPFMLEASISSTRHICRFWGLLPRGKEAKIMAASPDVAREASNALGAGTGPVGWHSPSGAVGQVIEDALRTAGLIR
ncbi:PHB depolymerase family esterase [Sphingomonas sanguinis]|uniref:PHB depolymerase family esterase n=1 Tax=Sphingomonas sanguinis TaxID=33051 RepID=A0ABU5LN09_9SPHN|nr:PHB depolymerase family esterase [Sphingomonas sanguinis]MDZ7281328.1 PHB depolymerase family esterase [Sphingomonas sanguinis]